MSIRRAARRTLGVVAGAVVVAACTSNGDAQPPSTPVATTLTSTVGTPADDGRLVVGVLLPQTGSGIGPALGEPMFEAIRLARDRINAAGGVNDADVELIEADEGENAASASLGLADLLAEDVDAIIGPASSTVALAELSTAVSAGVVVCSPTATALALDDFPDSLLFVRTVPSDSLQMRALAQVAEETGENTVAVAFLDDSYGRGLADAFNGAMTGRGIEIVAEVGFRGDDELTETAAQLLADSPGIVVVLADADTGGRLLSALSEVIDIADVPAIVVNDALRSVAADLMADLPRQVREALTGVAPHAVPSGDELTEPYAAAAFDCLNLIALAAVQAGTDSSARIASQIPLISVGGSSCRTFATCKEGIVEGGLQVDYNGPSGNTELSTRGDPMRARFERFVFDVDGRAETAQNGGVFDVTGA